MRTAQEDFLTLVDSDDRAWGKLEKSLVHQLGLLHRAFSVFLFNSKGELLLQQRALSKYHSGGLWTNTCCSHPVFGEEVHEAIDRRLKEEMGMHCTTEFIFKFQYKAALDHGMTEHELDHVYVGFSDEPPVPSADEVMDWKYVDLETIESDLRTHPSHYTEWFKICFQQVKTHVHSFPLTQNKIHVSV